MKIPTVLAAVVAAATAAEVVVFGDSWGSFSRVPFQNMFTSRGYDVDVDNTAIGGTTAKYWSRNPNSLLDRVNDNPDAKWVWLSIGGNDGIFELQEGRPIEDIIADAINNTRVFLDPLFAAHPDMQVVQFGYDIVSFGMSASCRNLGEDLFPWCEGDAACMNNEMYKLQYDYVNVLSNYYGGHHVPLNVLGTMQASRPSEVPAPYPNAAYFSPAELMNDCIHPNDEGFEIIFDRMFDLYWRDQLAGKKQA